MNKNNRRNDKDKDDALAVYTFIGFVVMLVLGILWGVIS